VVPHGVLVVNLSHSARDPLLPEETVAELQRRTGFVRVDEIAWKKARAMPFQASATRLDLGGALRVLSARLRAQLQRLTKRSTTGQRCYGNACGITWKKLRTTRGRVHHMKAAFSSELVQWCAGC
jgi:hypothetical protein